MRADVMIAERLGVDPGDVDVSRSYEVDWELIRTSVPSYEVRVELARAVTAAQATQGECRIHGLSQTTQVFPVLDNNGLHWECSHPNAHESKPVAALGP